MRRPSRHLRYSGRGTPVHAGQPLDVESALRALAVAMRRSRRAKFLGACDLDDFSVVYRDDELAVTQPLEGSTDKLEGFVVAAHR
jgi:hypothetical protein